MNVITRGARNAFRNPTRTISIGIILGLSIGLSLSMLIAHQAVNQKIESVKASVGNTISISPAGFNGGSQVNNSLTTDDLAKVQKVNHVSSITETLTDRLSTIGSSQPSFGFGGQSSSNSDTNQTSLTSPVTINTNGGGGERRFFVSGGGSAPTNFTPPVSFVGTNDGSKVDGTSVTIKSGKQIDTTSDAYEALISNGMASKNNLKVGSTFTAYNQTITVKGIFDTSNQAASGTVIVALPALQKLTGQSNVVTSATAYVDQLDNLSSTTSAVKSTLGSNADVTSSQQEADEAVAPLNNVKTISLYSLIGAVIAGAIIILLTMVMIVRERRREIGVIKAIGASNINVMFQFMVEAVTLTVIGAVIGIALGVVAANPITHQLVSSSTSSSTEAAGFGGRGQGGPGAAGGGQTVQRQFRTGGRGLGAVRDNFSNIQAAVGWTIILDGLGAAIVIALLGSSFASFFIAKIRPAEVLRAD